MKKIIKFISIILIIVFLAKTVNAINNYDTIYKVDKKIEKIVNVFLTKLDKKYLDKQKEKDFLKKINLKINYILENKKINSKKQKLLKDIFVLFNEKIFEIDYNSRLKNKFQKILESKIQNSLQKKINNIKIPIYIKNSGKKIYKISSDKLEFIENNSMKRLTFSKFYPIDSSNINQLKRKKGIIAIDTNQKNYFIENYNIETKIKYSNAKKYFKNYITYKTKFFKENNTFYSYNFKSYTFFNDKYGFYKNSLKENNIDINNTILYLSENKTYNFIKKYKKVKLINNNIIFGVVNKKGFIDNLLNDKLYINGDTDNLFIKLKQETQKITANKAKQEKIKIIYNYILDNLEYTKNYNINDKRIFSGILTYKNKNGVCEGYVKLMFYMLSFAGIDDVEIIRGDVIDSNDFPKIGHAWIKIGDKYYDPTFDDPIGLTKTKKFSDYQYFAIPKDLFYTNRFDYGKTPKYLKTKSLNFRKNLVRQNLEKLLEKYKNKNYLLLKQLKFKKENNIKINKNTTISDLKKIIAYYEVEEKSNGQLILYKNGQKKYIKKLNYYQINNKNISNLLEQLNYNLTGYTLLKWKNKNGQIEYRLAFNLKF